MSADNFLVVVKEGKRKWVGYHCCASHNYPYNDCYSCIGGKAFETTTELKAWHEAQRVESEINLEYGYSFAGGYWLTEEVRQLFCPCELKRFIMEVK